MKATSLPTEPVLFKVPVTEAELEGANNSYWRNIDLAVHSDLELLPELASAYVPALRTEVRRAYREGYVWVPVQFYKVRQ